MKLAKLIAGTIAASIWIGGIGWSLEAEMYWLAFSGVCVLALTGFVVWRACTREEHKW